MKKILTKSENDLLLRPSVDHLFYNIEELDIHFQSIMIDEIEDLMDIKVEKSAYEYFYNSDNVWYLKTEEQYEYLEIVLSEIEFDPIVRDYLNDIIFRNEGHIIEIINNL